MTVQVNLDQTRLGEGDVLYYDAIGLRITSVADPKAVDYKAWIQDAGINTKIERATLGNAFPQVVGAYKLWNEGNQGRGVTIAILDSGMIKNADLSGPHKKNVNFLSGERNSTDGNGHGTFVAGIVAGTGKASKGIYVGMAPDANLLNVRVSNETGGATEADVVAGLQWVYENRAKFNIRVVNLSLNSSVEGPYHTSPLNAAVEVLWFNGVVVVVSSGNKGTNTQYAPANDPFVITVGATDDRGTVDMSDDVVAGYSSYGLTEAGLAKPELVAPGTNIVGLLPSNTELEIGRRHPRNRVSFDYFKMSGTSMSAPVVTGAIALLLAREPNLTPDQVKFRLMATANKNWPGYDAQKAGAGYLDIYAAVHTPTTDSANTGQLASQMLGAGNGPTTWGSAMWNSVMWNTVMWNTVMWNTVMWNTVMWNSDYWNN